MPETPVAYAVICRTCLVNVWQGNELVETDGQVLLTAYAESTPSPACPSKVATCPHKAAAVAATRKLRAVTLTELDELKARVVAIELKVKP